MLGDLQVQRNNALLHVDHKNNRICRLNGDIHLIHRGRGDHIRGFLARHKPDAARIHECKWPALPLHLGGHAVPRHTRHIVHNGNPPAGNPVKQRGFTDIRAAHNGKSSGHIILKEWCVSCAGSAEKPPFLLGKAQKWRPLRDSNPCYRRERPVS